MVKDVTPIYLGSIQYCSKFSKVPYSTNETVFVCVQYSEVALIETVEQYLDLLPFNQMGLFGITGWSESLC